MGQVAASVGGAVGLLSVLFLPWVTIGTAALGGTDSCRALFGGFCQIADGNTNLILVLLIAVGIVLAISAPEHRSAEWSGWALIGAGVLILIATFTQDVSGPLESPAIGYWVELVSGAAITAGGGLVVATYRNATRFAGPPSSSS